VASLETTPRKDRKENMNNVRELIDATPAQLSQLPIQFGKHQGKFIFEVPNSYLSWLSEAAGEDMQAKAIGAKNYLQELESNLPQVDTKGLKLPPALWPWQKQGFVKYANRPFGGILAAAGSGKSRLMVEIMKAQGCSSALIVCPLVVFSSWDEQFKKWAGWATAWTNKPAKKIYYLKHDPAKIHIINFHALLNKEILETILSIGFEWIIIDESHNIKNHKRHTKQGANRLSIAGAALKLAGTAQRRYIITGTPKEKTLLDLYTQITFLDHGKAFGSNFYNFRKLHFIKGFGQFGSWNANPFTVKRIKEVIDDYCIVVKKEDLEGMPPVILKEHSIELVGEQIKQYKKLKKEAQIQVRLKCGTNVTITALFKIVEIRKLHQMSGGAIKTEDGPFFFKENPKLDYLFDCISSPETETPPVIFAQYKNEHTLIMDRAEKEGLVFGLIAGGKKDRLETRDRFMNRELDALVVQQQAGGVGVDGLQTVSRDLFFYSQGYSRTLRDQAIARVQRPGGLIGPVIVNDLLGLCEGKITMDQIIMNAIKLKDQDFKEFFYGE